MSQTVEAMTLAPAKCYLAPRLGAEVGGESQWRNRPPSSKLLEVSCCFRRRTQAQKNTHREQTYALWRSAARSCAGRS
jgi:hypothetical protein